YLPGFTRAGAGIRIGDGLGHRPFHAATAAGFLPGMGEDSHRARQNEKPPPKRGREAQFAENHCRDAIDIHRYRLASPALDACLHGAAYRGIAPGYRARGPGFLNEGEKGRAARIEGMKTM